MIVYNETMYYMLPLFPIATILVILYMNFYEVKFQRPQYTFSRNFKTIQMIMQQIGDAIEVMFFIIENFIYWRSKEKTLFMMNVCFLVFGASIPMMLIPLRYLIVLAMWSYTATNSPFIMAITKSIIQIALEYGITIERLFPTYAENMLYKIEVVYIPRMQMILRWIPYVKGYIPSVLVYNKSIEKRSNTHSHENFFSKKDLYQRDS